MLAFGKGPYDNAGNASEKSLLEETPISSFEHGSRSRRRLCHPMGLREILPFRDRVPFQNVPFWNERDWSRRCSRSKDAPFSLSLGPLDSSSSLPLISSSFVRWSPPPPSSLPHTHNLLAGGDDKVTQRKRNEMGGRQRGPEIYRLLSRTDAGRP